MQVNDWPYYVSITLLDDAHWYLWKQRRIIRQDTQEGKAVYWVRETDGEVTRWELDGLGRYVNQRALSEPEWQRLITLKPVQHQFTGYVSEEELREFPILLMHVEGVPNAPNPYRFDISSKST
jgi:hypothetical protein